MKKAKKRIYVVQNRGNRINVNVKLEKRFLLHTPKNCSQNFFQLFLFYRFFIYDFLNL